MVTFSSATDAAGVLLPVTTSGIPKGTTSLIKAHKSQIKALWLIGRPSTASDRVFNQLKSLMK